MAATSYYGAPGSGSNISDGSLGAQTAQQRASSGDPTGDNADIGNTHDQSASGTGAVIGGDASAKTSMGGGGGGGGGDGGGGGYSLGASIADSTTVSTGFSGSQRNFGGTVTFGNKAVNFGGTQTTGLAGSTIAWLIGGLVVLAGVAWALLRRGR